MRFGVVIGMKMLILLELFRSDGSISICELVSYSASVCYGAHLMSGGFKVGPVAALNLTNFITFFCPVRFRLFILPESFVPTSGASLFLLSLSHLDGLHIIFRIHHLIDRRLTPLRAFKSAGPFLRLQSERVDPGQWVLRVFVGVESAKQPYRILCVIPSELGVVISKKIVV